MAKSPFLNLPPGWLCGKILANEEAFEMNWIQRHLNYSWILLSLAGNLLIALILNLFVDVVWQPGLFGGFTFAPSVVDKSDFLLVLEHPLNMVAPLTLGGWVGASSKKQEFMVAVNNFCSFCWGDCFSMSKKPQPDFSHLK